MSINKAELIESFDLTPETADLIIELIEAKSDIDFANDERFPNTVRWVNQCYNMPSDNELTMSAINETLDFFGVECIRHPNDSDQILAEYCNTGETYDATIIRDYNTGEFVLSSWGDWLESWESEQFEENGTKFCGNCGEMTESEICDNCGRDISTGELPEADKHEYNRIKRLHGIVCRSLFNTDGQLNYDRTIRAMQLLSVLVHKYDPDSEDIWNIGESEDSLTDLIAGAYWFCVHNNGGRNSPEYALACQLSRIYNSGPIANGPTEDTNEVSVYNAFETLQREAWSVNFQ